MEATKEMVAKKVGNGSEKRGEGGKWESSLRHGVVTEVVQEEDAGEEEGHLAASPGCSPWPFLLLS